MRPDEVTRDLRHKFDPNERVRLAEDLSQHLITKKQAQILFATAKKAHDEAIGKLDCSINSLARMLCEGWEYRDIPCKVLWNSPKIGEKTFVRLDTGEEVGIEEMTFEERQESLPLEAA